MHPIQWTIGECMIAQVGKISTGFSLFTFSELKTRRRKVFFGLQSHSENGPKVLSVVLTRP